MSEDQPLVRKGKKQFPWRVPCAMNPEHKRLFHQEARTRLQLLADYMEWKPETYEFRYNDVEIRVSGETILHHDTIIIIMNQPFIGGRHFLIFRNCVNRYDDGFNNYFGHYKLLENIPDLAVTIREVRGEIPRRHIGPKRSFMDGKFWGYDEDGNWRSADLSRINGAKGGRGVGRPGQAGGK